MHVISQREVHQASYLFGKPKKIITILDFTGTVDEKPVTILPSEDPQILDSVLWMLMDTAKLAPALERLNESICLTFTKE